MTLRLIAVHAHPDDESSKGAATYASYVDRGVEVLVVSCTGGERGDILNESVLKEAGAQRDLPGFRRTEMARAQDAMNIQHRWLGYEDSGLPEPGDPLPPLSFASIPIETSAEVLVRTIREFQPHIMITYNENGGYPHPDHIRCHEVSKRAWEASGDPSAYPEAGEPWHIQKLYYDEIFNSRRIEAVKNKLTETDPDSGLIHEMDQLLERMGESPYNATIQLDVSDFFHVRDRALRAHRSQIPEDSFFFVSNELQRAAWPYEEYRLVESRVPTSDREDDLFDGVREDWTP
jgi:mycothiol S-conjugate amidase